ncbi:hypothetical protein FACS1894103_6900 [Campylobacterota bacterium]|nr:hypothetical protein FACS1894103_6900 [Campylobacterota bacterium]
MSFYTSSFKRFLWWGGGAVLVLYAVLISLNIYATTGDGTYGDRTKKLLQSVRQSDTQNALFGSSVSSEFDPSDFERYFSIKLKNLSDSGSTNHERVLLVQELLKYAKPETLFLEFFFDHSYRYGAAGYIHPRFDILLHPSDQLKQIKFYMSDSALQIIMLKIKQRIAPLFSALYATPNTYNFLDSNIDIVYEWSEFVEPIVLANPQITFYIYTPPISYAYFALYSEEQLNAYLDIEERWIARAKALPNVKLFDFRSLDSVRSDLSNYTDTVHYKPLINTLMVKLMSEDSLPPFDRATFLRGVANARLEATDRCGK